MNNTIFNRYYKILNNLRGGQRYICVANEIDNIILNGNEKQAYILIDKMVRTYEKFINRVGSLLQVRTVKFISPQTPEFLRSGNELIEELIFIKNCVLLYGAIENGLEKDVYSFLEKY